MARKNLYMGPRLKRVRRDLRLTQADMAADLDISASYVALMERNQRPVTAEMLLRLATTYRIDIADLAEGEAEETAGRLQAVMREPFFADIDLPNIDIEDIAASYPGFSEAFLRLHTAHEKARESLAERHENSGEGDLDPVAEARTFLAEHRNCFPALDDSAARLAPRLQDSAQMAAHIESEHGLQVKFVPPDAIRGALRFFDFHRRRVNINTWLGEPGRRFQLAVQIAALEQRAAIDAILQQSGIGSESGRLLADQALRSYWAAALVMPYMPFLETARRLRFDVEALSAAFEVSFEQAAHRLTTLQRPDAAGVPFFFLRIDAAGNVSKRLDGAGFRFARYGGACPLWNVHECFARPRELLLQRVELPDGKRFISIARTVELRSRGFGQPRLVRAVALACADEHLSELAYAQTLADMPFTPVGVTCRLCHRPRCHARSAPPIGREVLSDAYLKTTDPFDFATD